MVMILLQFSSHFNAILEIIVLYALKFISGKEGFEKIR